ncbi:hypothetical protein WSS15_11200 [Acetobacter pasteurianus]|nr:hypothetical protein WSS15_11200 [Acetobacter pasteurianus]
MSKAIYDGVACAQVNLTMQSRKKGNVFDIWSIACDPISYGGKGRKHYSR